RQLFPARAVRPPVLDPVLAQRALHEAERSGALRAEPPARDRAARVTLDLHDLAAFDVDELATADGTVGTDRGDDAVGVVDARSQRRAAFGAHRPAEPERVVLRQLANERPGAESRDDAHGPASAGFIGGPRCPALPTEADVTSTEVPPPRAPLNQP